VSGSTEHAYYFFSTPFDKAVCAVRVDAGGKVLEHRWEMKYD